MKLTSLTILLFLLVTIGCKEKTNFHNNFTSQADTIYLESIKLKGDSLFAIGASSKNFRDTNEWKQLEWFKSYPDYQIDFPDSIRNLELGILTLMFDTLQYFESKTKHTLYQKNYSLANRQTLMIKGILDDKEVLVVDQNNNKNFNDDTIRSFHEWNWNSDKNLIPIQYDVDFGNKVIHETGWYKIGLNRGSLLTSTSQFLMSKFTIDNEEYAIGVADDNSSSFCFFRPIMYPFLENGMHHDTLINSNVVELGEYIKLGKNHYQFAKLYNGSGTIVLIKANNFTSLIGTQIGMIAPDFNCHTTQKEKVSLKKHNGSYLLLANVSACYSPISSYKCYKDLTIAYGKKMEILCLDKSPVALENNIKELNLTGNFINVNKNEELKKYRPDFCSRTCYLINPEGRIIDKFEIFDWKQALNKHFNENLKTTFIKKRI